jgi:hypothetical protein
MVFKTVVQSEVVQPVVSLTKINSMQRYRGSQRDGGTSLNSVIDH